MSHFYKYYLEFSLLYLTCYLIITTLPYCRTNFTTSIYFQQKEATSSKKAVKHISSYKIELNQKSEPNIGEKLSNYPAIKAPCLTITPNEEIKAQYSIVISSIEFFVTVDKESSIEYIYTTDEKFMTKEGLKIGSTYSDIKSKQNIPLNKMHRWTYCILLKSGWYAAFEFNEPVGEDSKVTFFFKL